MMTQNQSAGDGQQQSGDPTAVTGEASQGTDGGQGANGGMDADTAAAESVIVSGGGSGGGGAATPGDSTGTPALGDGEAG